MHFQLRQDASARLQNCHVGPPTTEMIIFNYDDRFFSFTLRNNLDALNAVSSLAKSFFGADGQRKQVTLYEGAPWLLQPWTP
jgi:hypothetical protein